MKHGLISILVLLTSISYLSAQNNELVTVKAGNKILDYFPFQERYLYPQFTPGKVIFNNDIFSATKLNYNILMGEMQFIQSRDTLIIANKKDVKQIEVASDTFYYDKGYHRLISDGGGIKLTEKEYIKLKEVLKKDSYGTTSSGSATTSYGSLPVEGNFYKLTANEDMVFQKVQEYYIATSTSGFVPLKKKSLKKIFPKKNHAIQNYLKSNKVDFNSKADLIKLTDFLRKP
jgi:hypothetical protein